MRIRRTGDPRPQRRRSLVGACSSGGRWRGDSRACRPPSGDGEGALNLVAWAGYVVGGTGGEQVQGYDWVTPFETASGCKVTVKVGLDSANMVQLMKTGEYDGVSASGDATLRLIAGGDVVGRQLRPHPQLQGRLRGAEEPAVQHRQRRRLWRARTAAGRTC